MSGPKEYDFLAVLAINRVSEISNKLWLMHSSFEFSMLFLEQATFSSLLIGPFAKTLSQ